MLSFHSIFIAAAAFATIASAIPAAPPTLNIPGVPGDTHDSRSFGGLGSLLADAPADLSTKRGPTSPGDIFKTCSDDVELVIVKIGSAVNVDGGAKNVDHGLVIDLLEEVVVLLHVALKDLKGVDVVADLTLNGVTCTLQELARVVAGLLILIIKVVWLVLSIIGLVDVTLCVVIATIGTLLCELLEVVLALVVGLKDEVVVLIMPFIDQCNFARFTQILVILGLHT